MSRDKIEEMAINELSMLITCVDIETEPEGTCCRMNFDQADTMACALYNAGYRKQSDGEWEARTDVVGFVRCSVCKDCNVYDEWVDGKKWNFCPHCGAKMKGGAE